jgi:hypothetical protein
MKKRCKRKGCIYPITPRLITDSENNSVYENLPAGLTTIGSIAGTEILVHETERLKT